MSSLYQQQHVFIISATTRLHYISNSMSSLYQQHHVLIISATARLHYISNMVEGGPHFLRYRTSQIVPSTDECITKTPNLICRLFFKIDLLTDFSALCLTDFIDWRYILSVVCIFDPACELLPPWTKELCLCTDAPLPSLYLPPPPLSKLNVQYMQTVCVTVGGGMLNCAVDHILQEFLTRFRTYKIATPPHQ
jgi:hypothetical protein